MHKNKPNDESRKPAGCSQCRAIRMECTFDRPQQRRPRRSKTLPSSITDSSRISESETGSGYSAETTVLANCSDIQGLRKALNLDTSISTAEPTPTPTPTPTYTSGATLMEETPKDGSREAFQLMIKDYLDLLYPLMPIVHRPTFRFDVARERDERDPVFYSLLLSISAIVVSQLPRRFLDYKAAQWFFEFSTPKQLVMHLEKRIHGLRTHDYFETPAVEKSAISFFLACSYSSLNVKGRMSMYWAEMWVILRSLGANDAQNYTGLDFVEAQLRKKAFWLYVYYAVHERVDGSQGPSLLWKPIPDQMLLDSEQLETLLPLDLDDEYITPNTLYQQPSSEVPLASGFTGLIHIFLCLIDLPEEAVGRPRTDSSTTAGAQPLDRYTNRPDYRVLTRMFDRVRFVLDDIAPQMALWHGDRPAGEVDPSASAQNSDTRLDQLESLRANIQVTRLWVRSLIFERLLAMYHTFSTPTEREAQAHERAHWAEREDICEQLLAVLYNIKQKNLEPNGITLTYKIRQVAATLLDCPFEEHTSISRRARLYIERFVELLTLLDKYSFQDTQLVVWSDFERQERRPVRDFMRLGASGS
ncbi:uncharacterized protein A1O9_09814 [Exophiala aquamarina CBS 119918]|uniref:Transcription factor domain-containing protein n=1 Tax=Exophiala aquamarina CBS 119918 TaxID=1182545 RepID=A0A072P1M5_9EURO|nr:uncharacterized protein A1O9_09814 [Exophiala aquamarina CBS 119918]KEF54019.1 hypothetical protein A1O9_09814 [Exophiala aquamarina CBS 119918]